MEQEPCKIYCCYKATNDVNGKVYIGFATDPQMRWREHKRDAEKGRGYAFAAAIRKHGWNSFKFEVICCGKDKRAMLEHVEPALIEQYQSGVGQAGYNILRCPMLAPCGINHTNRGKRHSEATKKKLSIANKGKRHSEVTKKKLSVANKGKILSQETKEKLRMTRIGRRASEETRQKISMVQLGRTPWNKGKVGLLEKTRHKLSMSHKGHIVTKETRQKISLSLSGNRHPNYGKHHHAGSTNPNYGKHASKETRQKMSNAKCKFVYSLTDPLGNPLTTTNLAEFCKEHKLNRHGFSDMINGKKLLYKGYKAVGKNIQNQSKDI